MTTGRIRVAAVGVALCLAGAACSDENGSIARPKSPPVPGCVPFQSLPHVTAQDRSGGVTHDVAVSDSLLFAATDSGVVILPLVPSSNHHRRGVFPSASPVISIDAVAERVVAGCADGTLLILDAARSDAPVVTGSVRASGPVVSCALSRDGATAFAAVRGAGLAVIPIAAGAPRIAGVENTPGDAVDVAVGGNTAWVSDRLRGLRVVDVSTPGAPWLVASAALPGEPGGVAHDAGTVWVAVGTAGVVPVDVSRRFAPAVGSAVKLSRSALDVGAMGDFLWVAARFDGAFAVSLRGPDRGAVAFSLPGPAAVERVDVEGEVLGLSDGAGGVRAVRATTVAAPTARIVWSKPADVRDVAPYGAGFAVVDYDSGLALLGPPPRFDRLGSWASPPGVRLTRVAVAGSTAVVVIDGGPVVVLDLSNPAFPLSGGALPGSAGTRGLAIAGEDVFMARGFTGLVRWRLDGSEPLRGVSLGTTEANDVVVDGRWAFVASRDGLWVINASVFTVLTRVGDADWYESAALMRDDSATPLPVVQVFAATAAGPDGPGVRVWDMFNPGMPRETAFVSASSVARHVGVGNGFVLVAIDGGAWEAYRLANHVPVERTALLPWGAPARAAIVSAGWFVTAAGSNGLRVIPASGCTEN